MAKKNNNTNSAGTALPTAKTKMKWTTKIFGRPFRSSKSQGTIENEYTMIINDSKNKPKVTLHSSKIDKEINKTTNTNAKHDFLPSDIYVSPVDSTTYSAISEETGIRQSSTARKSPRQNKVEFLTGNRPSKLLPTLKDDDSNTNVSSLLRQSNNIIKPKPNKKKKNNVKAKEINTDNIRKMIRRRSSYSSLTNKTSKAKGTYLTNTKSFKRLTEWAFNEVDTNNSGNVDREELYTGMLLIHLYLATYLGPAATQPMSRNRVNHIFKTLDVDNNGTLDSNEFTYVMTILCSQIVSRIIITILLSLVITPYLAFSMLSLLSTYHAYDNMLSYYSIIQECIDPYYVEYRPYYDKLLYHACTEIDLSSHMPSSSSDYNISTTLSPYLPTTYFSCIMLFLTIFSISHKQSISYATFFILFYATCMHHEELNKEYVIPNMEYLETLPFVIVRSMLVTLFVPSAMIKIDAFFRIITDLTKRKVTKNTTAMKLRK